MDDFDCSSCDGPKQVEDFKRNPHRRSVHYVELTGVCLPNDAPCVQMRKESVRNGSDHRLRSAVIRINCKVLPSPPSAGEYVILDASQPLHAQYCVSVAHADMKQCFLADIACPANLSSLKVDVKQFKSELASAARCCGETHGTFMSRCSLDLFYITIRHLLHAQQPDVRIPVFIAFVPSNIKLMHRYRVGPALKELCDERRAYWLRQNALLPPENSVSSDAPYIPASPSSRCLSTSAVPGPGSRKRDRGNDYAHLADVSSPEASFSPSDLSRSDSFSSACTPPFDTACACTVGSSAICHDCTEASKRRRWEIEVYGPAGRGFSVAGASSSASTSVSLSSCDPSAASVGCSSLFTGHTSVTDSDGSSDGSIVFCSTAALASPPPLYSDCANHSWIMAMTADDTAQWARMDESFHGKMSVTDPSCGIDVSADSEPNRDPEADHQFPTLPSFEETLWWPDSPPSWNA